MQKRTKKSYKGEVISFLVLSDTTAVSLGDGRVTDVSHPFFQKLEYHKGGERKYSTAEK